MILSVLVYFNFIFNCNSLFSCIQTIFYIFLKSKNALKIKIVTTCVKCQGLILIMLQHNKQEKYHLNISSSKHNVLCINDEYKISEELLGMQYFLLFLPLKLWHCVNPNPTQPVQESYSTRRRSIFWFLQSQSPTPPLHTLNKM